MKPYTLFLLILLGACSSLQKQSQLAQSIESAWKNAPLSRLETHAYFSTLPLKDHIESQEVFVRTFSRRGRYPTSAYCGSLGGCTGLETGDCYHVFRVKQQKVDQYYQQGNCRIDNMGSSKFLP